MTTSGSQPSASEEARAELARVIFESRYAFEQARPVGIQGDEWVANDVIEWQASREVTEVAKYKALAKDHFEDAERSFDHVQVLRDRIARIREWVGEHQEHEVYEADSTNPAECTDECIWCPVVAILEEPEQSAGTRSHECKFDLTPDEERPTLVSADDAPDGPECIFCHRKNVRRASREVTEAEETAAGRVLYSHWDEWCEDDDPQAQGHRELVRAALVAAREVRP